MQATGQFRQGMSHLRKADTLLSLLSLRCLWQLCSNKSSILPEK